MLRIKKVSMLILGILVMCLAFTSKGMAQTDLDRLYSKYKGRTETTIFVGEREINAKVIVNYNAKGKPYRIIVYGEAAADGDLENLVEELGETKVKAGYRKLLHPNAVNFDQNRIYENNIQVSLYQKGTQYAKYGIKKIEVRNQLVGETGTPHYTADFFYFEVGDTARRSTLKPEKFDF
ncbi:hypothetical protein ACFQ3S_19615 [Mucilaginibacter terrae]|uniref:hypothetical protein n=1 Tax=Mucilaginibacter terrae TaxID=1955052 RepID=UPI00363E3B2B